MKVNQKYIADILQVSRVTVTKALQDHPDIALKTRDKVKKLADKLGYIPSGIGRSLSTKKTFTLGVIVPKINHSFFSLVIENFYSEASKLGYQIIIMVSFEDSETELKAARTLLSMNVDGILVDTASSTYSDKAYALIKKNNTALLFFDRKLRNFDSHGVFFDDYGLSYELTSQLIKKGHSKIMYLTGPQQINIYFNRLKGFKDAMSNHNLSIRKDWILATGLHNNEAFETFKKFLEKSRDLPDLIICATDTVALAVYQACEGKNISIPKDMGVIGFGNIEIASLVRPSLSTVDLDLSMACQKAIRNLVGLIEDKDFEIKDEMISGEILFRGSTKKRRRQ